jgi:hypothetical protein
MAHLMLMHVRQKPAKMQHEVNSNINDVQDRAENPENPKSKKWDTDLHRFSQINYFSAA